MIVVKASDELDLSLAPKTHADEIIQRLYILLNTVKGECPMYRDFGMNSEYLHMPINVAQTAITMAVMDGMKKYVPEVKLVNLRFETDKQRSMEGIMNPVLEVTDVG